MWKITKKTFLNPLSPKQEIKFLQFPCRLSVQKEADPTLQITLTEHIKQQHKKQKIVFYGDQLTQVNLKDIDWT